MGTEASDISRSSRCSGLVEEYSSGQEKGNRGKGHLALEMDLQPGMGRSRADLWLYNPRISGRDRIAALGMRDDPESSPLEKCKYHIFPT